VSLGWSPAVIYSSLAAAAGPGCQWPREPAERAVDEQAVDLALSSLSLCLSQQGGWREEYGSCSASSLLLEDLQALGDVPKLCRVNRQ